MSKQGEMKIQVKTAIAEMIVNAARMTWEEKESSPLRMCQRCRYQTRGMGSMEAPNKHFWNIPYCLPCLMLEVSEQGKAR